MNQAQTDDLKRLIAQLEADPCLLEPNHLRQRLDALDQLDVYLGDVDLSIPKSTERSIYERAESICADLEAINSELYQSIRKQIKSTTNLKPLLQWLHSQSSETPAPGLSYDHLDELLTGILQFEEPANATNHLHPEMVFYQPTPTRHILRLISATALTESDTLIDLGSGLGHVPILTSIFTPAQSIGIEVEPAYLASAQRCAEGLRLNRVTFTQQDARTADLSTGTVFYLYSPFTGTILSTVLQRLKHESANRPIKICTFGPCTPIIAKELWLEASAAPVADQIITFHPRA